MRARGSRVVTNYMEKYHARSRVVLREEAEVICSEADAIYAIEQGEITLPSLDGQKRVVCTIRFERILRDEV